MHTQEAAHSGRCGFGDVGPHVLGGNGGSGQPRARAAHRHIARRRGSETGVQWVRSQPPTAGLRSGKGLAVPLESYEMY